MGGPHRGHDRDPLLPSRVSGDRPMSNPAGLFGDEKPRTMVSPSGKEHAERLAGDPPYIPCARLGCKPKIEAARCEVCMVPEGTEHDDDCKRRSRAPVYAEPCSRSPYHEGPCNGYPRFKVCPYGEKYAGPIFCCGEPIVDGLCQVAARAKAAEDKAEPPVRVFRLGAAAIKTIDFQFGPGPYGQTRNRQTKVTFKGPVGEIALDVCDHDAIFARFLAEGMPVDFAKYEIIVRRVG